MSNVSQASGTRTVRDADCYRVIQLDAHAQVPDREDFVGLTLNQVRHLSAESGVFTNEARA